MRVSGSTLIKLYSPYSHLEYPVCYVPLECTTDRRGTIQTLYPVGGVAFIHPCEEYCVKIYPDDKLLVIFSNKVKRYCIRGKGPTLLLPNIFRSLHEYKLSTQDNIVYANGRPLEEFEGKYVATRAEEPAMDKLLFEQGYHPISIVITEELHPTMYGAFAV